MVTEFPAIVRYDFAFWGRNITSSSLMSFMESVVTCVAYKSAVDLRKLAFPDFVAIYGSILARTPHANNIEAIKRMIMDARDIYSLYGLEPKVNPQLVERAIEAAAVGHSDAALLKVGNWSGGI